jgi:hypothetical protein
MPKTNVRFEKVDAEQTVSLCRDGLICVSSLLASLLQAGSGPRHQETLTSVRELVDGARRELDVLVEEIDSLLSAALDQLVQADGWEHPGQVLERPRPDFKVLLKFCELRLDRAPESERPRLEDTRDKLARTVRIANEARHSRQSMGPRNRSPASAAKRTKKG